MGFQGVIFDNLASNTSRSSSKASRSIITGGFIECAGKRLLVSVICSSNSVSRNSMEERGSSVIDVRSRYRVLANRLYAGCQSLLNKSNLPGNGFPSTQCVQCLFANSESPGKNQDLVDISSRLCPFRP